MRAVLSKKTKDKENILSIPPAIVILSSPAQIPFPFQDRIKTQEEREILHDLSKQYNKKNQSKYSSRSLYQWHESNKD
mgnify:CR=1 FL=1